MASTLSLTKFDKGILPSNGLYSPQPSALKKKNLYLDVLYIIKNVLYIPGLLG